MADQRQRFALCEAEVRARKQHCSAYVLQTSVAAAAATLALATASSTATLCVQRPPVCAHICSWWLPTQLPALSNLQRLLSEAFIMLLREPCRYSWILQARRMLEKRLPVPAYDIMLRLDPCYCCCCLRRRRRHHC